MSEEPNANDKFFYYLDRVKYETDQATVTGALIKAKIRSFQPEPFYALFLEAEGDGPDKMIADDEFVSLSKDQPRRFYAIPPAVEG